MADADQMDGLIHPSFPAQGTPKGAHEGSQSKAPSYGDYGDQDNPAYEHYTTDKELDTATVRQQQSEDRDRKRKNRDTINYGSRTMEWAAKGYK